MNVTDLLAEQLDRAPLAPETTDLDDLLVAGRRGVRRRRVALGAGTAVAALALGGGLWALAPGGDSRATDDAPPIAGSPSAEPTPEDARDLEGELAMYVDGEVVLADGWEITRQIDNPMELRPPELSTAIEITDGTQTFWFLLTQEDGGVTGSVTGSRSDPSQKAFATMEDWVADQVQANQGTPLQDAMEALDLTADGRLVSGDESLVVVDQRVGIDLGASFAAPEDTTVAQLDFDGETRFVAVRRVAEPGNELAFEVGPPVNTPKAGTTLDSAIDYFRSQYASGEGLR